MQPNLLKHAPGFPSAAALRAVVTAGQSGYGMAAVGEGKATTGSGLVLRAAAKDDPRPLWVLAWGGTNTLAQALSDARRTIAPADLERLVARLRVYHFGPGRCRPMAPPRVPTAAMGRHPLDAEWRRCYFAWTGIGGGSTATGPVRTSTVGDDWVNANIEARGRSAPSTLTLLPRGDTPTFLGLIDNGLAAR